MALTKREKDEIDLACALDRLLVNEDLPMLLGEMQTFFDSFLGESSSWKIRTLIRELEAVKTAHLRLLLDREKERREDANQFPI